MLFGTGYSIEATVYRVRFSTLITKILEAYDDVKIENCAVCCDYINGWGLSQALKVFGSLKPASAEDTQLLSLVSDRMQTVEANLERELLAHKFVIDTPQAVDLLSGGKRIETVRGSLPYHM